MASASESNDVLIASNWKTNQQSEIEATNIPPTNDSESAILADAVSTGSHFCTSGNLNVALAARAKSQFSGRMESSERNTAARPTILYRGPIRRTSRSTRKPRACSLRIHASLTVLPDPTFLFALFDVYVNDKAGKLFKSDDD